MKSRSSRLLRAALETPWAILPAKLDEILGVLQAWGQGIAIPRAFNDGPDEPSDRALPMKVGRVAVVRVFGTIFPRANNVAAMSGGTSAEMLGQSFNSLVADRSVDAIVLDVDSPGGTVPGIAEVSDMVFAARAVKPVVAVANPHMFSAAYFIGASATEVIITATGELGSIGVLMVHEDWSKANEKTGVDVTYLSAGRLKTLGNPDEPLNDEAKALLQARVDDAYARFVKAVARGRGVTPKQVREGFGEGFIVNAQEAVRLGMADRIGGLDDAVARASQLARKGGNPNRARALTFGIGIQSSASASRGQAGKETVE